MDSLAVFTSSDNREAMSRKTPVMKHGASPLSGPSHYPPDDHDSTSMGSGQQNALPGMVLRQSAAQATPMNLQNQLHMQGWQHNTIQPSLATPLATSHGFSPSGSGISLQPTDRGVKRRRQDGGQQTEVQEQYTQGPGYKDGTIVIPVPTIDQQRLDRRFRKNDPRFRYLGAVSIIHPTEKTQSCASANMCRAQEFSLIHPLALQSRGFTPHELPPGCRKQFSYTHGIANPQRYIKLVFGSPHPPLNLQFRTETFLVLHEGAPYHGIDLYLGQKFLNLCFGENPATAFHNIANGGGDIAVGRQAGSSRGMQASTAYVSSLAVTRTSSMGSQYLHQGHSEAVTPSSRTTRSMSARAVETVAAPPPGAQETYQLSNRTLNVGMTPASGSTTMQAYPVPSFTYTPPSWTEGLEQYSYPDPSLNPYSPVFTPNNPGGPTNYLQVPGQIDLDVFSDTQSDSTGSAPNNSFYWPYTPGPQFNQTH